MNFDSFFESVEDRGIVLSVSDSEYGGQQFLSNEALFQLPLICFIVLLMAKDKRKPKVSEVGRLVGESIEDGMPGFKGSAQHIGWSANLRVRTVKAITFLESTSLIDVNNRQGRLVITELGKKLIARAMERDDDLSYNLAQIARAYRNICVAKQLDLELE
ncbi:hypothetical protein [Pseudomonas umsongensis]|uniref:Uncharacterized protein n=1 Tax=Pseudomonas umsongensis TaxID=198618 RepID=A0AAE7DCE5_9PSED|nr:hypothetical protein [Pseudomonas umsongensis]QJC77727.1 hypothetical protein HGP31_05250 [Pseudomonas umsongensis]